MATETTDTIVLDRTIGTFQPLQSELFSLGKDCFAVQLLALHE